MYRITYPKINEGTKHHSHQVNRWALYKRFTETHQIYSAGAITWHQDFCTEVLFNNAGTQFGVQQLSATLQQSKITQ